MDVVGKIALLTRGGKDTLLSALSRGYTRIYRRSSVRDSHRLAHYDRLFDLTPRTPLVYINHESGYGVIGRLDKVYYNPRYSDERLRIRGLLTGKPRSKNLVIYGGGTGVYAVYLSKLYTLIRSIDVNPEAGIYGRLTMAYNRVFNVRFENGVATGGEPSQDLLVMIPTIPIDEHLKYKFERNLIFYTLLPDSQVGAAILKLESSYPSCHISIRRVRPYSGSSAVYRFWLVPRPK